LPRAPYTTVALLDESVCTCSLLSVSPGLAAVNVQGRSALQSAIILPPRSTTSTGTSGCDGSFGTAAIMVPGSSTSVAPSRT
jgi:hypothetical protein